MIYGTGIDIIEIYRIKKAALKSGFLERCFTEREIIFFRERQLNAEVIAGSFAAKEAFVKALGTGFRGIGFLDIEILRDEKGKPFIEIRNEQKIIEIFLNPSPLSQGEKNPSQITKFFNDMIFHLSISHCREFAVAHVVIERMDLCESCKL